MIKEGLKELKPGGLFPIPALKGGRAVVDEVRSGLNDVVEPSGGVL